MRNATIPSAGSARRSGRSTSSPSSTAARPPSFPFCTPSSTSRATLADQLPPCTSTRCSRPFGPFQPTSSNSPSSCACSRPFSSIATIVPRSWSVSTGAGCDVALASAVGIGAAAVARPPEDAGASPASSAGGSTRAAAGCAASGARGGTSAASRRSANHASRPSSASASELVIHFMRPSNPPRAYAGRSPTSVRIRCQSTSAHFLSRHAAGAAGETGKKWTGTVFHDASRNARRSVHLAACAATSPELRRASSSWAGGSEAPASWPAARASRAPWASRSWAGAARRRRARASGARP